MEEILSRSRSRSGALDVLQDERRGWTVWKFLGLIVGSFSLDDGEVGQKVVSLTVA